MSVDEIFQLLELQLRARRSDLMAIVGQTSNEERSGELLLVEAAIERFENGEYGVCCLCCENLELDRLRRDPVIQFCASCADDTHGDNIV